MVRMIQARRGPVLGGRWRALGATSAVVALLAALSGCGSSTHHEAGSASAHQESAATTATTGATAPSGPTSTPSQQAHRASILVVSHARMGNLVIDPQYTCHGADTSPPLLWAGVPANTKEILVFVRSIYQGRLTTNWALAGIKPSVKKIAAGKVPEGAVVGRNSFGQVGYHLCPPQGALVTMGVYAFPRVLSLTTGFDPETVKHLLGSSEVQWGGVPMMASAPSPAPPIR
jgi:phosphatidylethanolamine-binding protein (PEBP) family uncharacterized protein